MQAAARRVGGDPAAQRAVHNPGLYRPIVAFAAEDRMV